MLVSLQQVPEHGIFLLIWILSVVIITLPLFPRTVIPNFLDGIRELWLAKSGTG
jgi:hypothetical protein